MIATRLTVLLAVFLMQAVADKTLLPGNTCEEATEPSI